MCFSAGASFGAGILLSVTGAAALSQAKSNSHKIIAAIHQFIFNPGIVYRKKTGSYYFI